MLEQKLEQDIKAALLAGDSIKTSTLRFLKAALLNYKVANGKRDSGITDEEVIAVLSKEAKKRQESADLYQQNGDQARAEAELSEKQIIESYLPAPLSEDEVNKLIDQVIKETGAHDAKDMGKVIGQVRAEIGAQADGSLIARLVREKLT